MNRPLTIMNLIADDGMGGSDRLAIDISKALKKRGHRVIWGSPSYCYLIEEARQNGIEIYNPYPSGLRDMKGLPALMQFCRKEGIDIVNAHHSHSRHMLLLAGLRGLKAKIVFTRHCIYRTVPYLGAFPQNLAVDMNIAVSDIIKRSLIRHGIQGKKVARVYGGIDIEKFDNIDPRKVEAARARYARKGAFNIGIVARLQHAKSFSPEKPTLKGHEVLFRAASGLDADFNLLVLGPKEEQDIAKLKLVALHNGLDTDRITFCGFQEDIAPFYKIMDLHVLPSPTEGLGLSVIEAMAAGVPCIGADSGGLREIITDGKDGFLFKPGDSKELGEKIKLMFNNKEMRDSFALNAREKVKELFDMKKNVIEIEKIFYNLIG